MTSHFVDLERHLPGIALDVRYAGVHNFLGRPVEGYLEPLCLLTLEAAQALRQVRERALDHGLDLLVFDGYRPQRAVDDFLNWVTDPKDLSQRSAYYPRVSKADMVSKGYIAPISSHSRGSSIDLTLVRRSRATQSIAPLDMGTPFDFFDTASHTFSCEVSLQARQHRAMLRNLMQAGGFRGIDEEWWHFTLEDEPFPLTHFDFPVTHMTWLGVERRVVPVESECSDCSPAG